MTRAARVGVVALPLAFLAVFFAYPLLAIVGRGLAPHWSVDLDVASAGAALPALYAGRARRRLAR